MLRASWEPYRLRFTFLARTSRQAMRVKDTYFVRLWDDARPEAVGLGECALFRGLSDDDVPDYEERLTQACADPASAASSGCSSIICGFEMARANLLQGGGPLYFPSAYTEGKAEITINGLVWMGPWRAMLSRIREKLDAGFRCIKIKIGGIDFDDEIDLLRRIRQRFGPEDVMLRLDANGSFSPADALHRLDRLSAYGIHSIEQPIRAGQPDAMARICAASPIPIALDEELIGVRTDEEKRLLLSHIRPQYIILKPSLCGGFAHADGWIAAAEEASIGWWATSALESSVGLNAIAQWLMSAHPASSHIPQGLGTGALYSNNTPSANALIPPKLRYICVKN